MKSFILSPHSMLLGLLVVLLAVSHTPAQKRLISAKEYLDARAAWSSPDATRGNKLIRLYAREQTLGKDGAVVKSIETISESPVPDRTHRTVKITEGNESTEVEYIVIGSMRYERKNRGTWTKTDLSQIRYGDPVGGTMLRTTATCHQYSVETKTYNNQQMHMYEDFSVDSIDNELKFREYRWWIGEDGLKYREEFASGKLYPRVYTGYLTLWYTYPDEISPVEAPIP